MQDDLKEVANTVMIEKGLQREPFDQGNGGMTG
jgi:hypothetical protein